MSLHENIKNKRTEKGISQRELARRIGMSGQMISKIEKAETTPSIDTLNKIAEALNVQLHELVMDTIMTSCETEKGTIVFEKGDVVFPMLLADIGCKFIYSSHHEYNKCGKIINFVEDPPIMNYNNQNYAVDKTTETLLKRDVMAYIEFKIQQIARESPLISKDSNS